MTTNLELTFEWKNHFETRYEQVFADLHQFSYPHGAKLCWEAEKEGQAPKLIYRDQHIKQLSFNFADYWRAFAKSKAPRGPLFKAISRACGSQREVIDATCGTGKDSLLLLSWGFEVHSFERHPLIYLLLDDAKRRFAQLGKSASDRFHLYYGSFFSIDHVLTTSVVYYDPMYPHDETERKSALPRQEIQLFRSLVGADQDIENNINVALKLADKLILKRSLHADTVAPFGMSPQVSYKGKNTRYDLFVN